MNSFLARQPIFDRNRDIHAYEILYRSGLKNRFTNEVGVDAASSRVVFETFQNFGLENLTGGKPAFINFSAALLEEEIATLFPQEYLVVEVLETVAPTEDVVAGCRKLKKAGYTIALDDFIYSRQLEPLIDLADIIKVDFIASNEGKIRKLLEDLANRPIVLLAEKVETWSDFYLAEDLGFQLFQGFFFSKPEVLGTARLAPLDINYLQLISAVNQRDLDFDDLAGIVANDVALSFNLLKLVNSVFFAQREQITSLRQALVILGEREIRKWVTLISMQGLNTQEFTAPISASLIRARFAELLAHLTGLQEQREELFLAGLFSLLDVILQRPMDQILADIQASSAVKEVLLKGTGPYAPICKAVFAYEQGRWHETQNVAKRLDIKPIDLTKTYLEALKWHPQAAVLQGVG